MRKATRFVAVGALLLPLVISCGEDEEPPCCPESGCLQIHGPSYHCEGGDTPAHDVAPTHPVLEQGSVTIRWPEGTPSLRSYVIYGLCCDYTPAEAVFYRERSSTDGADAGGDAEADAGVVAPVESASWQVVSLEWTAIDREIDGTVVSLGGLAHLCDAEEDEMTWDSEYSYWDGRAWRCRRPTGELYGSRHVRLRSTSVSTEVGALADRRSLVSFAADDGSIDGSVELTWTAAHRDPGSYTPLRCVDN